MELAFLKTCQAFFQIGTNGRGDGIGRGITDAPLFDNAASHDVYARESPCVCARSDRDEHDARAESDAARRLKIGNDT